MPEAPGRDGVARLRHGGGRELGAVTVTGWGDLAAGLDAGPDRDPKTRLQEWAMGLGLPPPAYVVVSAEGPPHDPRFTIEARLPGLEPAMGAGRSKREAEKAAAALFLEREKIQP
jgi:ribonuclease-3